MPPTREPESTPTAAPPRSRAALRRRAAGRIAIAVAGAALGAGLLGVLWPAQDRGQADDRPRSASDLAEPPRRPITVLVVGLDSDRLPGEAAPAPVPAAEKATPAAASPDPQKPGQAKPAAPAAAKPPAPASSDALLLLRVDPDGPLQVLALPTEVAVNVPGQSKPQPLGNLYRLGGLALTADGVRGLLRLDPGQPDRYVLLSRAGLRRMVNLLGRLEVSPPRKMLYEDRSQKYRIDLQSGLQRLDGAQVEQLLRFRDPEVGEPSRREHQQLVLQALIEALVQPARLAELPQLVQQWQGEVETNLDPSETLSLLAAGLNRPAEVRWLQLPLGPLRPKHGGLRQLDAKATLPPWKVKS
ncbi:MAG: LCP family protein [Prochlorococcaceae cyanobacterium]|jgi:LCP family protein required for cell wall assembly